jgi:hypothetical protein
VALAIAPALAATGAGSSANYTYAHEWTFDNTTAGWAGTASTAGMSGATCSPPNSPAHLTVTPNPTYMAVTVPEQDCWITSPSLTSLDIHLSKAPWLVMRLKTETPRPSGSYSLDVYWVTTTNTTWGETQAVHTMTWNQFVNTDSNFHTFAVDVGAHSTAWKGQVTALRIDLEEWEQRGPYPAKVSTNVWDIASIGLAAGPTAGATSSTTAPATTSSSTASSSTAPSSTASSSTATTTSGSAPKTGGSPLTPAAGLLAVGLGAFLLRPRRNGRARS